MHAIILTAGVECCGFNQPDSCGQMALDCRFYDSSLLASRTCTVITWSHRLWKPDESVISLVRLPLFTRSSRTKSAAHSLFDRNVSERCWACRYGVIGGHIHLAFAKDLPGAFLTSLCRNPEVRLMPFKMYTQVSMPWFYTFLLPFLRCYCCYLCHDFTNLQQLHGTE